MTCSAREICATICPVALDVSRLPLEVQKARAPLKSLLTSMATVAASRDDPMRSSRASCA